MRRGPGQNRSAQTKSQRRIFRVHELQDGFCRRLWIAGDFGKDAQRTRCYRKPDFQALPSTNRVSVSAMAILQQARIDPGNIGVSEYLSFDVSGSKVVAISNPCWRHGSDVSS
jgi:hypothetical protein